MATPMETPAERIERRLAALEARADAMERLTTTALHADMAELRCVEPAQDSIPGLIAAAAERHARDDGEIDAMLARMVSGERLAPTGIRVKIGGRRSEVFEKVAGQSSAWRDISTIGEARVFAYVLGWHLETQSPRHINLLDRLSADAWRNAGFTHWQQIDAP